MITYSPLQPDQYDFTFQMSKEIWYQNYRDMISDAQIEYMLNLMYNPQKIREEISNGYQWELISYNDNFVGYLAYVLKEDNRVFLSKIYLKIKKLIELMIQQ